MGKKKEFCHLCGLESDFFPSKGVLHGISCKRCGDYYMDDFLIECGEPKKAKDKAILSGYTRWEKELRHSIPEIKNENYEEIIRCNKSYSDAEKVDKLLLYYSKKYPDKGSYANYDLTIDYPITYSQNSNEYLYFLQDVAHKRLAYIKVLARGSFKIQPKGWERIEWLKRIRLADKKYDIESEKIMKEISHNEAELIERAGVKGSRHSSGLARKRRDLYLQATIEKLEKKLGIDRNVIIGQQIVLETEDINFLSGRVSNLAGFEKNFLADKLKEIYQDCRTSQGIFDHDIAEVHKDVDSKVKSIFVDLEVEGLQKEKPKRPKLPEIYIDKLLKMDESKNLEFKSTFQWDIEQGQKNKELRKEVVITIAAFNNTEGGYIIIGVSDDKKIFGLEKDYSSFKNLGKREERDVFLQTLSNVIEDKISKEFVTTINVEFYNREGKDICRVKVNFGDEPAWVKENKKDEVFYIRTQNSEKSLTPKESHLYIHNKWKKQ